MTQVVYWIWLQLVFGVANRRSVQVMEYFPHPRELYDGIMRGGPAAAMLSERERAACEPSLLAARRILARARKTGCDILTPDSSVYPAQLAMLPDRPAVLYVKGDLTCLQNTLAVAMVGTRSYTPYGRNAAEHLAGGLAAGGAVVVSGLAHGIDTECHRAALDAGGKTVGVLGCGLDIDYPRGSGPLKTAMSRSGAVITELPFGTAPIPANFPQRNRIISGLCQGAVVVEADRRSGSLLTARLAREQGRDLFAVPGSIFEQGGQGVNTLIQQGARLVQHAGDILAAYPWHSQKRPSQPAGTAASPPNPHAVQGPVQASPPEPLIPSTAEPSLSPPDVQLPPEELSSVCARRIFAAIGAQTLTVDDIAAHTSLPAADILAALTELEIGGFVTSYPGRRFGLSAYNKTEA